MSYAGVWQHTNSTPAVLSLSLGGRNKEGGFSHVAYLCVVFCRQFLPLTKVSQWEVTTQSSSDWKNLTADRKLSLVLQFEWVGQVSQNISVEVIWDQVMNQRVKHLLLYVLTYSNPTGLTPCLKVAYSFGGTLTFLKCMWISKVTPDLGFYHLANWK